MKFGTSGKDKEFDSVISLWTSATRVGNVRRFSAKGKFVVEKSFKSYGLEACYVLRNIGDVLVFRNHKCVPQMVQFF